MVVGRGAFTEAFPLFSLDLLNYAESFIEKLTRFMNIRDVEIVSYSSKFRPALSQKAIYRRPQQNPLPIRLGIGGEPGYFVGAGTVY